MPVGKPKLIHTLSDIRNRYILRDDNPPKLEWLVPAETIPDCLQIAYRQRRTSANSVVNQYCALNNWSLNDIYANLLYLLGMKRWSNTLMARDGLLKLSIGQRLLEDYVIAEPRNKPAMEVVAVTLYSRTLADFPDMNVLYVLQLLDSTPIQLDEVQLAASCRHVAELLKPMASRSACDFYAMKRALSVSHPGANAHVRSFMYFLVEAGLAEPVPNASESIKLSWSCWEDVNQSQRTLETLLRKRANFCF